MNQPTKSFASLSSTLLARKGQARPAMRPHVHGLTNAFEDLGWNDMGNGPAHPPLIEADIHTVQPELPAVVRQQAEIALELGAVSEPFAPAEFLAEPVLTPEQALADGQVVVHVPHVAPEPEAEPGPVIRAKRGPRKSRRAEAVVPVSVPVPVLPRARAGSKGKAAFTLRLDSDRHLRLRLACAVSHRSAQMIVTEALDAFLGAMPEVEALAARMTAGGQQ